MFDAGIIPQRNAYGQATYIGQLNLHLSGHNTQKLSVEDKRERDFAVLAKKLPALDAAKVTTEIGQVRP